MATTAPWPARCWCSTWIPAAADIVACCRVAELLHDALAEDGLPAWAKTSGSKGMQLYVPVTVDAVPDTSEYAKELCLRPRAASRPGRGTMAKQARPGRVYIDWSQNHQAKTTIAATPLRARQEPTVSTPLTWRRCAPAQRADETGCSPHPTSQAAGNARRPAGDLDAPVSTAATGLRQPLQSVHHSLG